MKKAFIAAFFSLFFLFGCQSYEMQKQVILYGYDFTKYSKNNFLFTPEKYSGKYESVGLMYVLMWPEIKKLEKIKESENSSFDRIADYYMVIKVSPMEGLDSLYDKATKMGADCVMNLEINSKQGANGPVIFDYYELSGFAIKRLDTK